MEFKTYHCMDPNENIYPYWLQGEGKAPKEENLVEKFKKDPDSFFPPFYPPAKTRRK